MTDNSISQIMLFSGKGGVGKTTLAAATAVRLAHGGARVLVMSTDPAHSLSDAVGEPLGPRPVRLLPNLDAMEVDARSMFAESLGQAEVKGEAGSAMKELLGLVSETPGIDEFGAIEVLLQAMEQAEHDVVILDTAPTGHTLRLLMVPQLLDSWFGKLLGLRHRISRASRLLRRFLPGGSTPDSEQLGRELQGGRDRVAHLRDVLTDPKTAQIVLVTIPEEMGVEETRRTLEKLAQGGLPVGTLVVNQLQPESATCTHCMRRRAIHLTQVDRVRDLARGVPVRVVESVPRHIRGPLELALMGELLWGARALLLPEPARSEVASNP